MSGYSARIRLTVDVPFRGRNGKPDESGHSEDRVDAARRAEEIAAKLKVRGGKVVEALVEHVEDSP